ncbi:MAG TPA: NUDIX domain-containing protein [Solirubrobacterales bacterium]
MSWRRRFRRRAARVVLLDPDGRVLLLHLDPASDPDGRGYWYLPGGGMMPFEAIEAAARRELREEIGVGELELGPVIGERPDVTFVFRGRRVVQDEWYVAGSAPTPHVGTGRHGDGEQRAVAAHRWWALDELTASGETVFPPGLEELVRAAATWASRAALVR